MAIEITGDKLSFDGVEFKKGDVTASKDFELKRKSDDGIPIKRLRAFEGSSTFIDMNRKAGRKKNKYGGDLIKGETLDVFVKDSYEALHIDPYLVSIGPKPNIEMQLTGSISTLSEEIVLSATDKITISGTTTITGGNTQITGGDVEITGSTYISGAAVIPQPWLDALDFATGSNPVGTYGLIMNGGVLTNGFITADNALSVMPGTSLIYGALGTVGGTGNTAETSQDIVIQPNTTTIINVSDENPSYTIASGINYTISVGADVTIINTDQTFAGGNVGDTGVEILEEEVVVGPDTSVGTGGVAFTQIISTNTIAGAGATTLNVTDENLSVTINQGIEYTIPYGSNVTIINSNQTFTGGAIDSGISAGGDIETTGTTTSTGGTGNTTFTTTDITVPAGTNTVIYVNMYNDSYTISTGTNYTIQQTGNVIIKLP